LDRLTHCRLKNVRRSRGEDFIDRGEGRKQGDRVTRLYSERRDRQEGRQRETADEMTQSTKERRQGINRQPDGRTVEGTCRREEEKEKGPIEVRKTKFRKEGRKKSVTAP